MDLKQLKYFVQVAELGSFAKASDVLDVPQPTLSRQVKALELSLRASLLHRNGRGVELTPMGVRFLEQAHGVIRAADTAMLALQEEDRRFIGHVACGMTPSVGRKVVAEYVRRFRRELPHATLSVSSQASISLLNQISAGKLDFVVTHDSSARAGLHIRLLRRQKLYVVGPMPLGKSRKATCRLEELNNVPLILPSRAYAVRRIVEVAAASCGVALNIRSEVDVLDAIFELVSDGVGRTIATDTAIVGINLVDGLSVQRIASPDTSMDLALVTPTLRHLTPLQQKAAQLAEELLG